MSRLASVLRPDQRRALSLSLASRAVNASREAGLDLSIVSASPDVRAWADRRGLVTYPDPGGGLSVACAAAVAHIGDAPWIVLHADLPLVSASALRRVAQAAAADTVLVPSLDGGTNVIASTGRFPFAYGPGSFHRHLARTPAATVLPSAALSIDIDTPAQYAVCPELAPA